MAFGGQGVVAKRTALKKNVISSFVIVFCKILFEAATSLLKGNHQKNDKNFTHCASYLKKSPLHLVDAN